ncbi:MAG: hypothetical protein IJY19_04170 [Ruminococcus sp.]|nr:hypothetical protein [Ruminococcus sp.]
MYICYHCSEEDGDIEFQSISEQIEHLNELREQLQTVKEMITDVSICSPYVVILQKWLLAVPNTKIADWKAADLCEDDKLDVFDLCLMKRMLIEQD